MIVYRVYTLHRSSINSQQHDNMQSIKITITIIASLALIAGILKYSTWRDAQLMASMDRYEQCMLTQYGTTAAAWYAEHQSLPVCK